MNAPIVIPDAGVAGDLPVDLGLPEPGLPELGPQDLGPQDLSPPELEPQTEGLPADDSLARALPEGTLPARAADLPASSLPRGVARRVLGGASALGLGMTLERGCGFLANILAARLAGAPAFGAYSLGISTANNISSYAAGGIGATAARFSGKYGYGGRGYSTLARALAIVSLVSAAAAAVGLWAGAGPIAHLLHKTSLTGFLRWAAISAVGIILLECARGFFVGQRRLAAVVLLSVLVGLGMVSLLPWAARSHLPQRMIVAQGAVTLTAVAVCLLLARPLGLTAAPSENARAGGHASLPLAPVLREVWGFGLIQLAGLVGANLSGWWLIALVARADTTLVQMSFFAIASQLRNIVGLGPSLLTEGSYAVMADPAGEQQRTPHHVMALCTFAATSVALLLAGVGMILLPFGLVHLYGRSYAGGVLAACVGLAVAVVHMGNAPVAARLSIVSIRSTGVINTVWAIFVASSATVLLLHGGSAALAMWIFFAAHVLAAALVLAVLVRKDHVPAGMLALFALSSSSILALVLLAQLREQHPAALGRFTWPLIAVFLGTCGAMWALGKRHGWLPTAAAIRNLRDKAAIAARLAAARILNLRRPGEIHGA